VALGDNGLRMSIGRSRFARALAPAAGALLFGAALWVLHRELATYHLRDILNEFRSLPPSAALAALGLTVASYVVQTLYDALAVRYAHHHLPYRRIALASFVGYSFSNTIGYSLLTGGSVRFRLYSGWGLSTVAITRVIAFCTLTFWLGFLTVSGSVFLFGPPRLPAALHVPVHSAAVLGGLFLLVVLAYIALVRWRREPIRAKGWELYIPTLRTALAQIGVASLDWVLAGAVLYALLPRVGAPSFPVFLGLYLLAQTVGLLSQIPGGLGVFETVLLLLLTPDLPASAIAGSLLAFRVVYYLLPLVAGAALLGAHEAVEKKEGFRQTLRIFGRWAPQLTSNILAGTTFAGGAVLLFSGATPTLRGRLAFIRDIVPLPLVEISHFLGSLTGGALLLIAWGLQRRLDSAYVLASGLLGAGVVFSLLKGFDYEEGAVLLVTLLALLPCRSSFYRKGTLLNEPFSPGWITAVGLVLAGAVWLGFFAYRHVEYSSELWWRFAFAGDAPRFLRATVGVFALAVTVAVARLLRPVRASHRLPVAEEAERARAIVAASPSTQAHLALLGDKALFFSERGEAFIMYGIEGRSWVAMGDPVGPEPAHVELVWRYREECDRHGGWPVFYETSRAALHLYLDLGLTLIKLGEEARVPLSGFSLEGNSRKWLRNVHRRYEKDGISFEAVEPAAVPALLPELRAISDAWLAGKSTREKGFSLGFFDEAYLRLLPLALVKRQDRVLAFANVWMSGHREELSVDLMRHVEDAPNGVMDYLFSQLMLWGAAQGYGWFNLGMVPFSGMESRQLAPLWQRFGALLFRHGEHFYNFQGLRQFKSKFDPVWEPKYLASPGGLALPRILANIGALVSRGLKGVVGR
jgi:phosphatidylglycerol lysyltransferase